MSKLIRNEWIKILSKKSLYIMLILTIAFMIFSNVMNKRSNEHYYRYSDQYLSYLQTQLEELDPNNPEDQMNYMDVKTQLDLIDLSKKYPNESWQNYIINQKAMGYISNINQQQYGPNRNEKDKVQAQKEYQEFLQKLEADDWRYFATKDLEDINQTLKQMAGQSSDNMGENLALQKQILEWRLEKNISYAKSDENTLLQNYESYVMTAKQYEESSKEDYHAKREYQEAMGKAMLYKCDIENNQKTQLTTTAKSHLTDVFQSYEMFLVVIVIMITGAIVSEEFNKGTIKLLLVKPYTRTKILMAKFITCVLVLIATILFLVLAQWLIGGITYGFESYTEVVNVYDYTSEQIISLNWISYIIIIALTKIPMYLLLMTLAFAISTLFTNTAFAIVLPLLGYLAGSIINQLALVYKLDWLTYFVTLNWNLQPYLFGGLPEYEGLTMPFSIVICAIYFIFMLVVSGLVFKKRNIKNI